MPKAYADVDMYEAEIEERNATLRSIVEESKWLVDLCALLALAIASNVLLFVVLGRAIQHGGLTIRLAFGLLVIAILVWKLWNPAWTAVNTVSGAPLTP